MSRRVHNDEIEMGSDSFLDIIANIVGILIILIVVAGVKVSRQPLETQVAATTTGARGSIEKAEAELVAVEPTIVALTIEEEPATEPTEEPAFTLPPSPPAFVSQPQDKSKPRAIFADSFVEKEARLRKFADREQRMQAEITRLANLKVRASGLLDAKMTDITKDRTKLATLQKNIEDKRKEAQLLQLRLTRAEKQKVDVEQIEHKVTPVGQEVTGREVHFRIARGMVSYVPVAELVDELKRDAGRRQNELMKAATYRGRVGPIRGYRMSYQIGRKVADPRFGLGMVRVVVNEWEVEPTVDLEQESVDQASRPGSLFDRRLAQLEGDANVTFWVYPDSFEAFRELQKRAHQDGLTVAGRPLPFGVKIAGSPNGTKSSAQ